MAKYSDVMGDRYVCGMIVVKTRVSRGMLIQGNFSFYASEGDK